MNTTMSGTRGSVAEVMPARAGMPRRSRRRLAQHERTGVSGDFCAAIRRCAIDDDNRANVPMRELAKERTLGSRRGRAPARRRR